METDQGFLELDNSVLVHDNIHGGMGLVKTYTRTSNGTCAT